MKRVFSLILAAVMLAVSIPVYAAQVEPSDLPYITSESVGFLNYGSGSDSASGASADAAKKGWGDAKGVGVVGLLSQGGTLVISGKGYMGADYSLPSLRTPVLITSKYAGVDYSNPEPASNPACAFKMGKGVNFTLKSDVILDDIIVFQEVETQNSIIVKNGVTLVIGKNVVNMTKRSFQVKIVVEAGGRVIVGGGDFEIENNGGEVIENYSYDYLKVSQKASDASGSEVDYSDVKPGVAFIAYNEGNNANDGLSASTPKKSLFSPEDTKGSMHIVRGGGTLVVPGRLYIAADYTMPKLGSELTITGKYDGVDYVNPDPEKNPAGGMIKMASGKSLTIEGDVRFENIILFQENTQNKIIVANGATVTFGEGVQWKSIRDWTFALVVEKGGTAIFETAENGFASISGDGIVVMPETAPKFEATRTYNNNFTDVTANHWFYNYVKTAYEYALANGTSAAKFSPDNKFTVAQALTAATNIHTAYNGGSVRAAKADESWYAPYVDYCLDNGIISAGQFADVNKNITRGEMATVFANILPAVEYEEVRTGSNPDVTSAMACYNAVQKLYNAGIVSGDAKTNNFRPNDEIVRSEACVIFTRIAAKEYRAK